MYSGINTVQSNKVTILNYLIDPTFTRVNRLLVLWFGRIEENNVKKYHRDSFSHCLPNVEIKDFGVLIDGKSFLYLPVKKIQKTLMRKLLRWVEITTTQMVIYWILKKITLIAIDLSKQT